MYVAHSLAFQFHKGVGMNPSVELSLEQEFSLRAFADQVQYMSHEQAQEFLVILYHEMMVKDMMYREILQQSWSLESDP